MALPKSADLATAWGESTANDSSIIVATVGVMALLVALYDPVRLAEDVAVVDLPGIYSLDANSLDEKVTRDYLLSRDANLIVNVVDASNLERNLYLTAQLLEMNVPIVLVLNMMDVARKRGIEIDTRKLSKELGCPVVPVVAISGEGIDELKQEILAITAGEHSGGFRLAHHSGKVHRVEAGFTEGG